MQQQISKKAALQAKLAAWLKKGLSSPHGAIVLCGLSIGLCYFPVWFMGLWVSEGQGSAGLPLLCAVVYLGFGQLWRNRAELAKVEAAPEDRLLGHILIVTSVLLFPFFRFEIWPQAMIWLFILLGIAISCWGVSFFFKYPLLSTLIALGAYPKIGVMSKLVWQAATPPALLERFMAWLGMHGLQLIGQDAVAQQSYILLAGNGVNVNWGCNGFNMALSISTAAWLMGIFYKQSWRTILGMVLGAIALSMIFNIPRIMLLTLAHVYWGETAFKFFHGPVGGQVFSGVLLTVYYYAVMPFINPSDSKKSVSNG